MKIPRGNIEELLEELFFNKLPSAVVRIPGKLQRCLNSFGYMHVWKVLRKMPAVSQVRNGFLEVATVVVFNVNFGWFFCHEACHF